MAHLPRPRLIKLRQQQLGDMLQRLAIISPRDVYELTKIVRDVLKRAEAEHKRRFQNRPDPTKRSA